MSSWNRAGPFQRGHSVTPYPAVTVAPGPRAASANALALRRRGCSLHRTWRATWRGQGCGRVPGVQTLQASPLHVPPPTSEPLCLSQGPARAAQQRSLDPQPPFRGTGLSAREVRPCLGLSLDLHSRGQEPIGFCEAGPVAFEGG